jgi:hypothetical protein
METKLWKTTIEVWTSYDPAHSDLEDLSSDVISGNAMLSNRSAVQLESEDAAVPENVRSFFTIGEVD